MPSPRFDPVAIPLRPSRERSALVADDRSELDQQVAELKAALLVRAGQTLDEAVADERARNLVMQGWRIEL